MSWYEEFRHALAQAKNESDIGGYLKKNLNLIRVLNEHAWNCVITQAEFPVGVQYRADFIILSACSGYWNCVLIEIQSPHDKIFNKKGEVSPQLKEAQRQIQEWKMYIKTNEAAFRDQLANLAKDQPAYCSNAAIHQRAGAELRDPKTTIYYKYKVVIGRRAVLDESKNQRRSMFREFEIVTFDRLLDYAKRLDESYC